MQFPDEFPDITDTREPELPVSDLPLSPMESF